MRLISLLSTCLPLLLLAGACSGGASTDGAASEGAKDIERSAAVAAEPGALSAVEEAGVADVDTGTEDDAVTAPIEETATLGAGCFWCVEAVLEQLDGVLDVTSGYMGGSVENPTYEQVCTGTTGHAEVVQVTFDPTEISYDEILDWFWKLHDPTTRDRQGADVGTQYRSVIFVHSDAQRDAAERSKEAAQASFDDPIVTEITAASTYYVAESGHQDYYRLNTRQGYCRAVITPKLNKLGLDDLTGE